MSGSGSDAEEPSQPPFERKRKRAQGSTEDVQQPGIHIYIPPPSTAAMAEWEAAQNLSSQPAAFVFSQPDPSQATQADTSRLKPLPEISTDAFVPYLDDTTGMDLDATTSPNPVRRAHFSQPHEPSSPVEEFSQTHNDSLPVADSQPLDSASQPRIGNWVLSPLTQEVRVDPPDYNSHEVLSQIPFNGFEDLHNFDYMVNPQQPVPVEPSQPSPSLPPVTLPAPRQSTPTDFAQPLSGASPDIISTAPTAAPTLTLPAQITSPEPTQQSVVAITSPTQPDNESSATLGWSTLPKREIIELVHRSSHIPDFLKDEIERFVQRGKRASSPTSQSISQHQRTSRHRSPVHSQSQSTGASNNDDSETQEDNFLRTKPVWVMDLLVASTNTQPSQSATHALRLTQHSQTSWTSETRDICLLLYVQEGTFSVQEVEEHFATTLRKDRRYSVWYDCQARPWNINADMAGASQPLPTDPDSLILQLQDRVEELQKQCEAAMQQSAAARKEATHAREQHDFVRTLYDTASTAATAAQLEAAQATAQVVLLQSQLRDGLELHRNTTELAVSRWKQELKRVAAQNAFLIRQAEMTEGEQIRSKAARWDQHEQKLQAAEIERQARIAKNEANRQQMLHNLGMQQDTRAILADGAGPFASSSSVRPRSPSPVDELDELAALAREADEAGDSQIDFTPSGRGKRQRRGQSSYSSSQQQQQQQQQRQQQRQSPLPLISAEEAAQRAAQLETAAAIARIDAQQDVDDHLENFMPRRTVAAPLHGDAVAVMIDDPSQTEIVGLDSMSMIPLTYAAQQEVQAVLEHDPQSAPSDHLGQDADSPSIGLTVSATQWGSLPAPPPSEPTQYTAQADLSGDIDETFHPYTQG